MTPVFKRTEKKGDFSENVCAEYNYVDVWEHDWKSLKKSFTSEVTAQIVKVPEDLEPLVCNAGRPRM